MKLWATVDTSRSGKEHLWREANKAFVSECGMIALRENLQPHEEAISRCKICEGCASPTGDDRE